MNRSEVNEREHSPTAEEEGPTIMRKGRVYFKTTIELNKENVEKFKILFPQHGALKEFLNKCLDKFIQIYEPTADKDIEISVASTVEEMKESGEVEDG